MIISKVKLDLFAKVSYRGQLEDEDVPLTPGTSPNTNITGKTVDAANNILSKVGVGGLAGYRPASNTGSYSSSTNVSSPFSTTQSEKDAYFSGSPSPTKFNWQDQDPADLATLGQSLANSVQQSWQGGQDVGTAASGLPVKNWVSEIADVISGQKAPTQEQLLQAQLQQWQESYEALAAQMAAMQGNMPNLDDILDYINKATYAEAPVLNDRFDATKVALADAALGMNYEDWLGSDQYSALARRYGLQGNQAMRDTLAQVASRTGGLASSYAQSAAQQQYNNYMAQLESAAQNQFGLEKNRALDDARAAFDFSDSDYERYLQDLAQYNQDRSFGMQTLQNALNEYWNQNDWNFKQMQYANDLQQQEYDRMLQQQQWNTDQDWKAKQWEQSLLEYQDSKDADSKKDAREQIETMLYASGGSLDSIPADLITQSGWGTEMLNAKAQEAKLAIAAANAKGTKRSSGGGGGGGNPKGDGTDWSSVEAWVEKYGDDAASNYIGAHYRDLGYKTKSEALADWQNHLLEWDRTPASNGVSWTYPQGSDVGGGPDGGEYREPTITNTHGTDWVNVNGFPGRVSFEELYDMVQNGEVRETYDRNKHAYTYTYIQKR